MGHARRCRTRATLAWRSAGTASVDPHAWLPRAAAPDARTAGIPRPPAAPARRWRRRGSRHGPAATDRSEEHTSELQSLMRISYAVFCLKKKKLTVEHHIDRLPELNRHTRRITSNNYHNTRNREVH